MVSGTTVAGDTILARRTSLGPELTESQMSHGEKGRHSGKKETGSGWRTVRGSLDVFLEAEKTVPLSRTV